MNFVYQKGTYMTEQKNSIADLAYTILKESNQPLRYTEITEQIQKVKKLKGNRPWCTVNAVLCKDPRFIRIGEGRTGLYTIVSKRERKKL